MRKGIIIAVAIAMSITACKQDTPDTRIMNGNYHDYMVIETLDGNEWLLDDSSSKENPYMKYDDDYQEYVSIYEENDLVQVVFDTKGTEVVRDDEIIEVRKIGD